jgi:hypothetical protein
MTYLVEIEFLVQQRSGSTGFFAGERHRVHTIQLAMHESVLNLAFVSWFYLLTLPNWRPQAELVPLKFRIESMVAQAQRCLRKL